MEPIVHYVKSEDRKMESSLLSQNAIALRFAIDRPASRVITGFLPIYLPLTIHLNCGKMRRCCILRQTRPYRLQPASLQASPPISSHLVHLICRILRHFQPSTITLSAQPYLFSYASKINLSKDFAVWQASIELTSAFDKRWHGLCCLGISLFFNSVYE